MTKRRLRIAESPFLPPRGAGVLMAPPVPGDETLLLFAKGEMPADEWLGALVNRLRDEGYEVAVERDLPKERP